jgi:PAS domain S-box-containing protein
MTSPPSRDVPTIDMSHLPAGIDAPTLGRLASMVFHAMHNAVMITDTGNRIVMVNRSFEQVTGYAAAEVQGQNPRILPSGRHPPKFYAELWRSLNETGKWSGDMPDRHKDGPVSEKEVHITVVRDAAGRPADHIAIFHDITKRKSFENSLREREQLLRTLIASTPDFVLIKDAAGRWLIANQAARKL